MGATPDIIDYSRQYLVITAYGAPLIIFDLVIASLLRGSGDAVKPMIIMISSTVLNIALDPFLIFGIGPFPEMGVTGAALATVIAQAFGALLGLYYLLAGKTAYHVKLAHLRPDMSIIKDIYRVGTPSAVTLIMESVVFMVFNKAVSSFGSLIIAAAGIVMRISDFAFMPIIGVSNGLLPIVGYNFGAKNYQRLWQAVKLASLGIIVLLVTITTLLEIFAPQIVGVFSNNPTLTAEAVPAMRIMLSAMIFIGPSIMFITTFQGLSQGTKSLVLSLLRQFIIFIPILYLFRHLFGLTGIWVAMPASDTLSFVLVGFFIYREYRKHKRE
jgi:putative MATE family efflux protein